MVRNPRHFFGRWLSNPARWDYYIGSTDTDYNEELEESNNTEPDRDYLIRVINFMIPDINLTAADIVSHWAGMCVDLSRR